MINDFNIPIPDPEKTIGDRFVFPIIKNDIILYLEFFKSEVNGVKTWRHTKGPANFELLYEDKNII